MTDDNMTTSNAKLNAAPPKCDAQLGRVRGHHVARLEAALNRPLTSGQLQHMSLPASDESHPKRLSDLRTRTRQCEKTKVVNMREKTNGRVGVTVTGVSGDGRASIRPGCGVGTTFTGALGLGRAEL